MGLNRKMRRQLDITRTDLHILMTKLLYFKPRDIIRLVFMVHALLGCSNLQC